MEHDPVPRLYTIDGKPIYEVYCGNFGCPTRREPWKNKQGDIEIGRRFDVVDGVDLIDGEVWVCLGCR